MKQIYKDLYEDNEGKYLFATNNDTRYIVDQHSYLLVYIIECLQELKTKEYKLDNGKTEMSD